MKISLKATFVAILSSIAIIACQEDSSTLQLEANPESVGALSQRSQDDSPTAYLDGQTLAEMLEGSKWEVISEEKGVEDEEALSVFNLSQDELSKVPMDESTQLLLEDVEGNQLTVYSVRANTTGNEVLISARQGDESAGFELDITETSAGEFMLVGWTPHGDPHDIQALSGFFACMHNVLDSHVGDIITVLGVAGGVGCVGCGIAGAFLLGISALGCSVG